MHTSAQKATLALILVALGVSGCGTKSADHSGRSRDIIVEAKHTNGFAQYAGMFPANAGTKACSVAAGAPGNVFKGTCSTRVSLGRDGVSTVVFAQDFGIQGHHTWTIRVAPDEPPNLTRDSGGGLAQLVH